MSARRPGRQAYLDHLARDSARFLDVLGTAPAGARVPSCPDWDVDDLLWHLTEVQWFWGEIVRRRAATPQDVGEPPARPAGRAALVEGFARVSRQLSEQLAHTDPGTPVWTWANEQRVGFVLRRQAQEALVHRLDAELATATRTPLDPSLAADGVDEALRVMFGGAPAWGRFTPDGRGVQVTATDTGDRWTLLLGRWAGTSPDSGTRYDEPAFEVAGDTGGGASVAGAAAELVGTAEDLDCLLWNRPPPAAVARRGDAAALAVLDAVLAAGVQ